MANSLLMLDLMRTYLWFDEQLRSRLAERGWGAISRSQSLVLTHIANGVSRASRIAENLGVTRQAMSQLLSDMEARGLIELQPDPFDRRAQLVQFAAAGTAIREDAQQALRELERDMEAALGSDRMRDLREALERFPER